MMHVLYAAPKTRTMDMLHQNMYQTIEATIVGGQVEANSDNSEEK